jgi:hypothetical protein
MKNFNAENVTLNVWHCRHCNASVKTEGTHLCEKMREIGKITYATVENGSLIIPLPINRKGDFPPGFGKKKSDS